MQQGGGDILGSEEAQTWLLCEITTSQPQAFEILHTQVCLVMEGKQEREWIISPRVLLFHRNVTLKFGNTLNCSQCSLRVGCFYL